MARGSATFCPPKPRGRVFGLSRPDESPPPDARTRTVLTAAVFLIVVTVVVAAVLLRSPEPPGDAREHPAVGKKLPMVGLLREDLSPGPTDRDLAGKVVLVNFWGPWCPPCRAELPELANLVAGFDRQQFQFVPIAYPQGGGDAPDEQFRGDVAEVLRLNRLDLTVYFDPQWKILRGFNARGNVGFPTTLLLDRQGTIRGVWQGYSETMLDGMKRKIRQLLDEPAAQ